MKLISSQFTRFFFSAEGNRQNGDSASKVKGNWRQCSDGMQWVDGAQGNDLKPVASEDSTQKLEVGDVTQGRLSA